MRGFTFHPLRADPAGMDLTDLVPSLKRALASPGEFDATFPDSTDTDLAGTLADAVAECQLDGFLGGTTLSILDATTTPDLTNPQQALVILYAMARVVTARVANLRNRTRYKAGNTEAETEQSASVLVQILRDVRERKRALLDDARAGNLSDAFAMVDMYVAKSIDYGAADVGRLTGGAFGSYQIPELR